MTITSEPFTRSPVRLVGAVCAAQVLVQLGAFFWPALLPGMMQLWQLSNREAGWIVASFYGAYMLSVPALVTLTDRIDPKRVYLFGVASTVAGHFLFGVLAEGFWSALILRALTGMGWAGTYMTGLKLLADRVDAKMMSRATAGHAASIGISGALSFATGDTAIRFGRKRLIVIAMLASILIGATIGFLGSMSYGLAAVLLTVYGVVVWLDSSSLTAGTAGTAEPSRRVQPLLYIPCLATRAVLWGRCWSDGSSTCPAACHNWLGDCRS